jgi:hypothetical protein
VATNIYLYGGTCGNQCSLYGMCDVIVRHVWQIGVIDNIIEGIKRRLTESSRSYYYNGFHHADNLTDVR